MISKRCLHHLRRLASGTVAQTPTKCYSHPPPSHPHLLRTHLIRPMATVSDAPSPSPPKAAASPRAAPSNDANVLTTIYSFPSMEPLRFAHYPPTHLALPLRRDLLHRAVVYEGDNTRQGTGSTKWRSEVHGSGRKMRPQKGTGRARIGDRKSPMLRGGGVAHGPKPRDFGTKLFRKVYDRAWRTALSYRYKRGELVVVETLGMEGGSVTGAWVRQVMEKNGWGSRHGRSLLIAARRKKGNKGLFKAMELAGDQGVIKEVRDVDVKNLLEKGRIIIEQRALHQMIKEHCRDLVPFLKPIAPPAEGYDFSASYH